MPNRRKFLRVGLTGVASLSIPALLRLRTEAADPPHVERTAIIVVFLHGGASHLETWDPKPDAASEYRGPFHTIATKTEGLNFCELLPKQAAISDKFTILRSMVHTGFCHGIGQQQLFTGHQVREFKPRPDHPEFLSVVNYLRHDTSRSLPNYVGVPPIPYLGAAYLGPSFEPFSVFGDPNSPQFSVPNIGLTEKAQVNRLSNRRSLRQQLDNLQRNVDQRGNLQAIDDFEQAAWSMLTSPVARRAFDLSLEEPRVRERYGRNTWGQQCLMARRLVEAGVDLGCDRRSAGLIW